MPIAPDPANASGGTVERNVRYRRPRASQAEIDRVTALCGLEELVAELPKGWNTEVGGGGSRTSTGSLLTV